MKKLNRKYLFSLALLSFLPFTACQYVDESSDLKEIEPDRIATCEAVYSCSQDGDRLGRVTAEGGFFPFTKEGAFACKINLQKQLSALDPDKFPCDHKNPVMKTKPDDTFKFYVKKEYATTETKLPAIDFHASAIQTNGKNIVMVSGSAWLAPEHNRSTIYRKGLQGEWRVDKELKFGCEALALDSVDDTFACLKRGPNEDGENAFLIGYLWGENWNVREIRYKVEEGFSTWAASIAIYENWLVIGHRSNTEDRSALYAFEKVDTDWQFRQRILPPDLGSWKSADLGVYVSYAKRILTFSTFSAASAGGYEPRAFVYHRYGGTFSLRNVIRPKEKVFGMVAKTDGDTVMVIEKSMQRFQRKEPFLIKKYKLDTLNSLREIIPTEERIICNDGCAGFSYDHNILMQPGKSIYSGPQRGEIWAQASTVWSPIWNSGTVEAEEVHVQRNWAVYVEESYGKPVHPTIVKVK